MKLNRTPRRITCGYNSGNLTAFREAKGDAEYIADHFRQQGRIVRAIEGRCAAYEVFDLGQSRWPVAVIQLEERP